MLAWFQDPSFLELKTPLASHRCLLSNPLLETERERAGSHLAMRRPDVQGYHDNEDGGGMRSCMGGGVGGGRGDATMSEAGDRVLKVRVTSHRGGGGGGGAHKKSPPPFPTSRNQNQGGGGTFR